MQRFVSGLLCVALALASGGCGSYYVIDDSERVEEGEPRVLESETSYSVSGVSLANDELVVNLDRTCNEVREVETKTIITEEREYNTTPLWIGTGSVAGVGFTTALSLFFIAEAEACDPAFEFDDSCAGQEDQGKGFRDAALYTAVGTAVVTLIAGGVGAYYELADHDVEYVEDEDVERRTETLACDGSWPVGRATLMAPHANVSFDGDSEGDGRVTIQLDDAPREAWVGGDELQLQLPDTIDWVDVNLPSSVRSALLKDAEDAERIYVWFEDDETYGGLLEAGATRIQATLTDTRRYQIVADETTRARIQTFVEESGGNPDSRRQHALEAARKENIRKVVQLDVTPIMDEQVQVVLAVYNTASGDRIFMRDAPADVGDAVDALSVFETLASAYLSWEKQ